MEDGTLWYLELRYAASLPEGGEKDTIVFGAGEAGYADMEQPEPYRLLLMTRNVGLPYQAGGLVDQPYLLLMEMDAAARGESRHHALRAVNLKLSLGNANG